MNSTQFEDGEAIFFLLVLIYTRACSPWRIAQCRSCAFLPQALLSWCLVSPWWWCPEGVIRQLGTGRSHLCNSSVLLGADTSKPKAGLMGRKWYRQTSCPMENYLLQCCSCTEVTFGLPVFWYEKHICNLPSQNRDAMRIKGSFWILFLCQILHNILKLLICFKELENALQLFEGIMQEANKHLPSKIVKLFSCKKLKSF